MAIDFQEASGIDFKEEQEQVSPSAPSGESLSDPRLEYAGFSYTPGMGSALAKDLLTNDPVGAVGNLVRSIPATAGGIFGAGLGAGVASVPLAGVGSVAGEGLRQIAANIYSMAGGGEPTPAGEALSNIGAQGVAGAAGQTGALALGKAIPLGKAILKGEMRVGPNIPTSLGGAVIEDPGILARAASKEEMSARYAAFEKANNLVSPSELRAQQGSLIRKPGQTEDYVNEIHQRLRNPKGNHPSTQDLYNASQDARFLRDQTKMRNPQFAADKRSIELLKKDIDDALELATAKSQESYAALRQANFESKAGRVFNSPFPQNINGEPNVLRAVMASGKGAAAGAAAGAYLAGPLGAAIGVPLGSALGYASVSPLVAGAAIRAANALSPIAKATAAGFRFAPGSIAAYYQSVGNNK